MTARPVGCSAWLGVAGLPASFLVKSERVWLVGVTHDRRDKSVIVKEVMDEFARAVRKPEVILVNAADRLNGFFWVLQALRREGLPTDALTSRTEPLLGEAERAKVEALLRVARPEVVECPPAENQHPKLD